LLIVGFLLCTVISPGPALLFTPPVLPLGPFLPFTLKRQLPHHFWN